MNDQPSSDQNRETRPSAAPKLTGEEKTLPMGEVPEHWEPALDKGGNTPPESAGERIGRYQLMEPLGKGGFGLVWRAEQREPVRREVALKVIKPGMDSREIVARFEAERQALALMDHPHIAAVLDGGATDLGRPYFVMELVRGEPVTRYCDERHLSLRDRLALFVPICLAVQHAHQKGILHRDIKPSNVLVEEIDGQAVPKIIDFGIAKALAAGTSVEFEVSAAQTMAGLLIGTPAYMSPEQASGGSLDVDARSDIYSLGVLLFEMLAGSPPISVETFRENGIEEVLRLIREEEPPSLERRLRTLGKESARVAELRGTHLARLASQVRGELSWIVAKAMEKDRERRYASAAAFADDIQRYLHDEPVAAGPPSQLYRFRKLIRRNRVIFAAATGVAASLLLGLAVSWWQLRRAMAAEAEAAQRLAMAESARDAAEDLIAESVFGMRQKLFALGRGDLMEDMVAAAEDYFAKLPEPLIDDETERYRGALSLNRALISGGLGDTSDWRRLSEESLKVAEELAGRYPEDEAMLGEACLSMMSLAMLHYEHGEFDSLTRIAERIGSTSAAWVAKHGESGKNLRFQALGQCLGAFAVHQNGGSRMETFIRFQLAAQTAKRLREVAGDSGEVAEVEGLVHFGNGRIAHALGRPEQALAEFHSSAEAFRKAIQSDGAIAGIMLREMEAEAIDESGVALRILGKTSGDNDKLKRGEAMIRQAMKHRETLIELEPRRSEWWRDLGFSHANLAQIAGENGDESTSLHHREEHLRCAGEALTRQKDRPLLYVEKARASSAIANLISEGDAPARARALALTFDVLELWRQGMERAGYVSEDRASHSLVGEVNRLRRLAEHEKPDTALEWYERAGAIIGPLVGKLEGGSDVVPAYLTLLSQHQQLLESLGRGDKAAELSDKVEALIGSANDSPQMSHDVAKVRLQQISGDLDLALNRPPGERVKAVELLRPRLDHAHALIEGAVKDADHTRFHETLAFSWGLRGKLENALGRYEEAGRAFSSSADEISKVGNRGSQMSRLREAGQAHRMDGDWDSAEACYRTALNVFEDGLDERPSRGHLNEGGHIWGGLAQTLEGRGEIRGAAEAWRSSVDQQALAFQMEPAHRPSRWVEIEARLELARLLLRESGESEGWPEVERAFVQIAELVPDETDVNRLTGITHRCSVISNLLRAKRAPEGVAVMERIVAIRERLEVLRFWPTDLNLTSASTLVSLGGYQHDLGQEAAGEAAFSKALDRAEQSGNAAILADVCNRLRSFHDSKGRHAEAEKFARLGWNLRSRADLGWREIHLASGLAAILYRQRKFAEAEEVALEGWRKVDGKSWPGEPMRLRIDLANQLRELYRQWNAAEPDNTRSAAARRWAEEGFLACPPEDGLNDGDMAGVFSEKLWRLATWIEAGNESDYLRERSRILRLVKDRPSPAVATSAAWLSLLIPAEGLELAQAVKLAETAYRDISDQVNGGEWQRLVRGLALIRQGNAKEALAVVEPLTAQYGHPYEAVVNAQALAALAHHLSGDTARATEIHLVINSNARTLKFLRDGSDRRAATARLFLRESGAVISDL